MVSREADSIALALHFMLVSVSTVSRRVQMSIDGDLSVRIHRRRPRGAKED